MIRFADRSRYEYKYRISLDLIPYIRDYIKSHTVLDPHLKKIEAQKYTVRSIYFDTPELDFYYEKMDGLKIRKKLRVRTYNEMSDYAFLEIKRKFVNCITKERSRLPIMTIERLIDTPDDSIYEFPSTDYNARLVSGKFLYNLLKRGLVPILLVVYDREAYVGKIDEYHRVTFDINVRARTNPDLGDILSTSNFVSITKDQAILELKYDDLMPKWMKNLTKEYNLKRESLSKYCMGVDACRDSYEKGEIL